MRCPAVPPPPQRGSPDPAYGPPPVQWGPMYPADRERAISVSIDMIIAPFSNLQGPQALDDLLRSLLVLGFPDLIQLKSQSQFQQPLLQPGHLGRGVPTHPLLDLFDDEPEPPQWKPHEEVIQDEQYPHPFPSARVIQVRKVLRPFSTVLSRGVKRHNSSTWSLFYNPFMCS